MCENQSLPHARPGGPAAADSRESANDTALKKRVIKHVIEDDCMFQLLKVRNAEMCSSAEAAAKAAAAETVVDAAEAAVSLSWKAWRFGVKDACESVLPRADECLEGKLTVLSSQLGRRTAREIPTNPAGAQTRGGLRAVCQPDDIPLRMLLQHTLDERRSTCSFKTATTHSEIQRALRLRLPGFTVCVPGAICDPNSRPRCVSGFPKKALRQKQSVFNTEYVGGMRTLLDENDWTGDAGQSCPDSVFVKALDAHCETVALSTAGYYETLLSHTTKHTQAEKEKFLSDAQHQFLNVLSSSNIGAQVRLLMIHEVRRLQAAVNAGAGWESCLYQEVMWQHHLSPLLHENGPLNGVVLGCGAEFQKSFLFGTSTFGEILCKVCAYAAKNQNVVTLPCYPMMYVFDNDELTQSDLSKKSKIHSACYSCHCMALLIDGKNQTIYVVDGNGPLIPGTEPVQKPLIDDFHVPWN